MKNIFPIILIWVLSLQAIAQKPNIYFDSEKDYKKGNTSPAFKTGEEAVAWLEKQGI